MLPRHHIILGAIFSFLLFWLFSLTLLQASLIFLASILIDFDHYLWHIQKKKDLSLRNAYLFLKKLDKNPTKPLMMLFHTIEFHILIALLGFLWMGFFYILIGMAFHSIIDLLYFGKRNMIYIREFSLIRYLILKKKYPKKYF